MTVESLAITRHRAAVDGRRAGDHAVGGQLWIEGVGEGGVLDEAPGVEEELEALPREELAMLEVLLVVLGRAALRDAGLLRAGLVVEGHGERIPPARPPAAMAAGCGPGRASAHTDEGGWAGVVRDVVCERRRLPLRVAPSAGSAPAGTGLVFSWMWLNALNSRCFQPSYRNGSHFGGGLDAVVEKKQATSGATALKGEFDSFSSAPPDPEEEASAPEDNASEVLWKVIDTLAAVVREYGKGAFDIEGVRR